MYDVCFQYGSTFGCDYKCPKFQDGDCDLCKEDVDTFKQIIDNKDLSNNDKEELYYLYGYTLENICDNKLYNWKEGR